MTRQATDDFSSALLAGIPFVHVAVSLIQTLADGALRALRNPKRPQRAKSCNLCLLGE
jgi:hypothetical protein